MLTVFSLLLTTTVQLSVSWEPENEKDRTTNTKNQDPFLEITASVLIINDKVLFSADIPVISV